MLHNTKLPISVFIVAQNEEQHIAKTLASVQAMDEVILVDSGSTDNTLAIAQKYGATIVEHEWMGYAKQKQLALSLCKHDWVLNLDGDEAITPALVAAFAKIIAEDNVDSVRMWRDDIFMHQPLSQWSKKANNHRFYRRSHARFDSNTLVHESAHVVGKEVFLNLAFTHYGYGSITTITAKNNHYSSLKAQEKFTKGKHASLFKLVFIFPCAFLKEYVLQRKLFSGRRGFILAVMTAYYSFLKEAKLYEFEEQEKYQKDKS